MDALLRQGGGGNVTIPHKEAAAAVLPRGETATCRSCNTFWSENGVTRLRRDRQRGHPGGAGPAGWRRAVPGASSAPAEARARRCGPRSAPASPVAVRSRTAERGARLRATGGPVRDPGAEPVACPWSSTARRSDSRPPIRSRSTPGDAPAARVALDLVYRRGETEWVRAMRGAGCARPTAVRCWSSRARRRSSAGSRSARPRARSCGPRSVPRWPELVGASAAVERWLLPAECLICHCRIGLHSARSADLSALCQSLDPAHRTALSPAAASRSLRDRLPALHRLARGARAVWPARCGSTSGARHAVHLLKYEGWWRVAEVMAETMRRHAPPPPGSTLVPIPLGATRLRTRGYNQSAALAEALGTLLRPAGRAPRDPPAPRHDDPDRADTGGAAGQPGRARSSRPALPPRARSWWTTCSRPAPRSRKRPRRCSGAGAGSGFAP